MKASRRSSLFALCLPLALGMTPLAHAAGAGQAPQGAAIQSPEMDLLGAPAPYKDPYGAIDRAGQAGPRNGQAVTAAGDTGSLLADEAGPDAVAPGAVKLRRTGNATGQPVGTPEAAAAAVYGTKAGPKTPAVRAGGPQIYKSPW